MYGSIGAVLLLRTAIALDTSGLPAQPPCQFGDTTRALPRGVRSVVDLGADPSGSTDSTAALQHAFDVAREENVTLFVPLGCYVVTDTLVATGPRNGRWQPTQIVGERGDAEGRRPTFVLPSSTPGFSGDKFRPMMTFWTNWCLSPGPQHELYFNDSWCGKSHPMSPWMFNMVVQDVDFLIGEGNPGAVGINMKGAQGCTLQDVRVFAAPDALAGVAGGLGGGGMFGGITVTGGRFGLDARATDGSATYVAVALVNQSCAGMLVGPGTGSTTAVVGLHVEGSPSMGGVVAAVVLPLTAPSACYAPRPEDPVYAEQALAPSAALADALTLVDASFRITGGAPCLTSNGSLWVQNMYSTGCDDVIVSAGTTIVRGRGGASDHVVEFALGRRGVEGTSAQPWKYSFPSIVDRKRTVDPVLVRDSASPPHDLQARHHWGPMPADWQTEGAVSALDLGAKGDGVTDDWRALQRAVDSHDVVVLPRGLYRLGRPLALRRRGSALVGVGDARSFLAPLSAGFEPQEQPVLDVAAAGASVKGLTVVTWSHLASTYAIRWSGSGVWRQSFFTREPESAFQPFQSLEPPSVAPPFRASVSYDRPLFVITGGGAFYDFDLDFGCCFGHANPKNGSLGPGLASTDEVLLQRPGFRSLLVNGSTSGLRFYPHNTEQAFSDAYTEIAFSFNVTLYNAKSENNYAALWIRDSDLISVHGFGGNVCPFPNSSRYEDSDIRASEDPKWADLGAGCCAGALPPLFGGKVPGGLEGCQAKCLATGRCGFVSFFSKSGGTADWCTFWSSSVACSVDARCPSGDYHSVHTYGFTNGYAPFMPSSFRVQRSSRVTLANIVNRQRLVEPTLFLSAGNGYDPRLYNMILQQDGEGMCDPIATPDLCSASPVLDRPVLWRWTGRKPLVLSV